MAASHDPNADFAANKAHAVAGAGGGDAAPKAQRPRKPRVADEALELEPLVEVEASDPRAPEPVVPVVPAEAVTKPSKPAAMLGKAAVQKARTAPQTAPKTVIPGVAAAADTQPIAQPKEIPMDMNTTVNDAQEKTKDAFAKTSALAGEYTEFAKGNVEAFVESGKILAAGLQDIGNKFIAESKAAFETVTADVKELSSVKSPTDFFKLQTELLRRNVESAMAYSSKNGEALLKLTNDVIAPLSGRVTLAVDKVRKAA